MTRFGKRKNSSKFGSSKNLLKRNPPSDILNKSKDALKSRADDVKKRTTKELPYMGSAESAAIADLLNEPGSIDATMLAKKISDSDECLNKLAFVTSVNNYFTCATALLNSDNVNVLASTSLDERVPIMLSVGISKILSDIIDDLKKTSKTTIEQTSGKTVHFIKVEDLFELVDKQFSDVINIKSQRVTDQNNDVAVYQILDKIENDKQDHNANIIKGLLGVNEKHVGKTFSINATGDYVVTGGRSEKFYDFMKKTVVNDVKNFISGCGRVKFVSDLSSVTIAKRDEIVHTILSFIVIHVISYTFVSTFDGLIRSVMDAGETTARAIVDKLNGTIIHRAMVYPGMITAVDLYGLSEKTFDSEIAHEIRTVKSVKEVFKNAIETYDYDASAIAAKTYRHEAPKIPSFLKSPEEILKAQMKLDKMLITPTKNVGGISTNLNYAGEKADSLINQMDANWFGRRRRSSKKRSSFGRKRRSSKKRSSFGRKRRSHRKSHKAVAAFGKKRRSSKRRVAEFGRKRRSSMKKRSSFGRKRTSHRKNLRVLRASFGRKRRSHKNRRASFGKKKRSSKRRASFGRKRRSSHRRRV
jgi:hypothetical protein